MAASSMVDPRIRHQRYPYLFLNRERWARYLRNHRQHLPRTEAMDEDAEESDEVPAATVSVGKALEGMVADI